MKIECQRVEGPYIGNGVSRIERVGDERERERERESYIENWRGRGMSLGPPSLDPI